MAVDMARVSVAWQGWPGAPGVTQFYFASPIQQADVNAIRTFFDVLKAAFPVGLTITVPGSGDYVSDADGKLSGTWSVGVAPAPVVGTGTGGYAGNAGAVIHWLTQIMAKNRRLRGRTFLVPLISGCYDTGGSIIDGTLTQFQTAAANLVTSANGHMLVWHRPKIQKGTGAVLQVGGSGAVTSSRVPDLAVSLRSRRI